jgi:hypothetical protein
MNLRWKIMAWLWPKKPPSATGGCANRKWWVAFAGPIEVKLTYRDTRQPNAYSREELVEMLRAIRENEKWMGWKVPEPTFRPKAGGEL